MQNACTLRVDVTSHVKTYTNDRTETHVQAVC